jgi:Domain of unknown function (DUF1996)
MRVRAALSVCVAVGAAVSLSVLAGAPSARSAASGGGDFIVRCFFTGPTQPMDPIIDPISSHTDHLHIFFGNMIQGTSSFPSISSGDDPATGATMENNGQSTQTNCQDTEDTAGYWMPAPFINGQAYAAGGPCLSSTTCQAGTNMHLRVYYLAPNGSVTAQEIPDGSIMVTGFPNGCSGGVPAGDCSNSNGHLYPNDLNLVRYTCGDSTDNTIMTPVSAWPYDCASYRDPTNTDDSSFNDGIVAIVDFPPCWNGLADWTPPNAPPGAAKVPGYVAPWIPDSNAPTSGGVRLNDFAYLAPGTTNCTDPKNAPYTHPVVQLEERFHLLTAKYAQESAFGEPSTCYGRPNNTGTYWNSTSNAENSPTPTDIENPPDNDSTVQVSTNPVAWGFHQCVPASAPASTSNLSFACTPNGDSICTQDIGNLGCGSTGHCFIGTPQWGFETLHADYWQAWQEGTGDVFGVGTDPSASPGYFRDLIEDCTNSGNGKQTGPCSFINSTTPTPKTIGRVFSET